MKIYLLNGINDSIANTTGSLVSHLRALGHDPQHLYRTTVKVWYSRSKKYLLRTSKHLELQMDNSQPTALIAHSQGCLQAYFMMSEAEKRLFDYVILFSPAMNRSGWKWGKCDFEKMLVIYNPNDLAIFLGSILRFHPFGKAGSRGFKTKDARIEQREDTTGSEGFLGHSHYFNDANARDTADAIDRWLSQF